MNDSSNIRLGFPRRPGIIGVVRRAGRLHHCPAETPAQPPRRALPPLPGRDQGVLLRQAPPPAVIHHFPADVGRRVGRRGVGRAGWPPLSERQRDLCKDDDGAGHPPPRGFSAPPRRSAQQAPLSPVRVRPQRARDRGPV